MDSKKLFYQECFVLYYPIVYNKILSKTGDVHTAEDLAQEVFYRFLLNMAKVEDLYVRAWLFSVTRNVLYEHYRSEEKGLVDAIDIDESGFDTIEDDKAPDFDVLMILDEALASIDSERDRLVFTLIASRGFTYAEAGELLDMTSRQVKYRFQIAIKHILLYFTDMGLRSIDDFF